MIAANDPQAGTKMVRGSGRNVRARLTVERPVNVLGIRGNETACTNRRGSQSPKISGSLHESLLAVVSWPS